jgi:hypothetical protein
MRFGNGMTLRLSVNRRGGSKDEPLDLVPYRGIEQVSGAFDVGPIKFQWLSDRFGDIGMGGQVQHGVETLLRKKVDPAELHR